MVGALVGIAIEDGAIPSVDVSIMDLFPNRAIPDVDRKRPIQLRHLLSMSAGLEWDETITYTDPQNSELWMIMSRDPITYVLAQHAIAPSGQVFNCNGGLTEILASAVTEATGLAAAEFARSRLFGPLGITRYEWRTHQKNDPNDAEAICEAVWRPRTRFVPGKGEAQQAVLTMHRARELIVSERTAPARAARDFFWTCFRLARDLF